MLDPSSSLPEVPALGRPTLLTNLQLALKHRQNKAQRQRIIVFVCSPIEEVESDLVKLAKKMKKATVSVDFILFGDTDDENQKKLNAFNGAVKSGEGSNMVIIPPSSKLLSDQLLSTPILLGEQAAANGESADVGGGSSNDFEFGIDPSVDPELALALRMSMEEEKARQEKRAKEEAEQAKKASLESVKEEEDDESKPLLDNDGEPSNIKKEDDKPYKDDDGDKMDTS